MDLSKAKEIERLKRNTLMNERVKEADGRRKQIDATAFMNPSLKGNALVESTFTQVEASLEDALHIRKELLLLSADLRSDHERKQLEKELHRALAAQVNQIKQSCANLGIPVSPSVWTELGTKEMAIKQRASTAIKLMYLEAEEAGRDDVGFNRADQPPVPRASAQAQKGFVSYSHDSQNHMDRVVAMAQRLRTEEHLDVMIDQFVAGTPSEGWPVWCDRQIRDAKFVLCVCTETFARRFEGLEKQGVGLGVGWESQLIAQHVYDEGGNDRFIPVVFDSSDVPHIPTRLRGATRIDLSRPDGFADLSRIIKRQPMVAMAPLGSAVRPPSLIRHEREQFSPSALDISGAPSLPAKSSEASLIETAVLEWLRRIHFQARTGFQKGYPPLAALYPNGDKFGYVIVSTAAGMETALQQAVFHDYNDLRRLYVVMAAVHDRESAAFLRTIPTRTFPYRTSIVVGHLESHLFIPDKEHPRQGEWKS